MPIVGSTQSEIATNKLFLSKEDKEIFDKKKKALDDLLSQKGLAKYKIDIMFGKGYTNNQPSAGAVSFWESGSKFHGGGDTIMHMCPGKSLRVNECEALIPDASHGYGFLVCPSCNRLWKGEQVHGQVMARLLPTGWAKLVLKYFMKMGMSADIRIKYHPEDIRAATQKELESSKDGDVLDDVRVKRHVRIYPLANIIKDTSAGADLESRFLAFIKA